MLDLRWTVYKFSGQLSHHLSNFARDYGSFRSSCLEGRSETSANAVKEDGIFAGVSSSSCWTLVVIFTARLRPLFSMMIIWVELFEALKLTGTITTYTSRNRSALIREIQFFLWTPHIILTKTVVPFRAWFTVKESYSSGAHLCLSFLNIS